MDHHFSHIESITFDIQVEKCYAPNHAFIQNFLKKLIISAESEGIEVHDDLYDHHAYLMSSKVVIVVNLVGLGSLFHLKQWFFLYLLIDIDLHI